MKNAKMMLTPLQKALRTLEEALDQPKSDFIRDATIQRFEYTYELSWKFMKRYLESQFSEEEIDALPRRELFRYARENGLIKNIEAWFGYHEARNATSHAYDEEIAERVYEAAAQFLPEAKQLLVELEKRT